MAISNRKFLVDTLNTLLKTGVGASKHNSEKDISGEVPTCVHSTLVTNYNEDEVTSLIEEVLEETDWYGNPLYVGEVNVVPAGSAHLIVVLLF